MVQSGLTGSFRVIQGQRLHLHTLSSNATELRAYARVRYDGDTQDSLLVVSQLTVSGDKVEEDFYSAAVALKDGWVSFAVVQVVSLSIKRGQTFVRLALHPDGAILLQDYAFQNHWPSLGVFKDSGPSGGDGYFHNITVKSDGAPVASTSFSLGVLNTIRKVYGYAWYYNSSADAASRTLAVQIEKPLFTLPTGFSAQSAARVWIATDMTLTAGEEGTQYANSKFSMNNDNGTVSVDNNASQPTPFPYLGQENDTGVLMFDVANGHVNDRDVIYALIEEWLVL